MSDIHNEEHDGIAVVGMAGRFPGAFDVQSFWENIKNGVESIRRFSEEELDAEADPSSPDATNLYVPAKGILEDVDKIDARFFGYYPKEAALMDPQHRVFLENCWEALEHAGYDPERYPGAIGVFAGCYLDTYIFANLCSDRDFLERLIESIQVGTLQTELGNDKDYLATRVAFKLNLRGPSLTIQTACSTSLVAISHACQSLQTYSSDMALAGGVTITFPEKKGYFYKEGGMLSSDGHCRAFDACAQGTVFSNASAVVVLKRLEDAITDRDTIYAVIKGHACNNDGAKKVSYTAPSISGQSEVIALAQAVAGIDARTVGYIEAHGTATPMGDPIEIQGLTQAFRQTTDDNGFCAIGSLKTNIGHVDVASGACGLIKTSLALHEKVLPPSLHYSEPNPNIDFESSPFFVNTELKPWPEGPSPRRAGVSSFGVGGTNAHVVLEEAPPAGAQQYHERPYCLLPLSAKSDEVLEQQRLRLAHHLRADETTRLADVAYTLQVGRSVFDHRAIFVSRDSDDAIAKLEAKPGPLDWVGESGEPPGVVFMFPGQGAQFPGMARELYETEAVFASHFDRCAEVLRGELGHDLGALLFTQDRERAAETLRETTVAQPAIFSVEYALAQLWLHWGLQPEALVGHSVGEFTAACLAGVFSVEDALRLVTVRGRLMQDMPRGAMLSVRSSATRISELLPEGVSIAAINAPELIVVSGPFDALDALQVTLEAQEIAHSRLHTSHAFHSAMMDAAVEPTVAEVSRVVMREPTIPIYSTVTGTRLEAGEATDPSYWGRNLRETVRFAGAISALAEKETRAFVEVGPGQTLSTLAKQILGSQTTARAHASLGHAQQENADYQTLLSTAGRLWLSGVQLDWNRFGDGQRRVPLPTYPFERKRHWVEPASKDVSAATNDVQQPSAAATTEANGSGRGRSTTVDAARLVDRQMQVLKQQIALLRERGGY